MGHNELVDLKNECEGHGFFVGVTVFFDKVKVLDLVDLTKEFAAWSDVVFEEVFCLAKIEGVSFDGCCAVDVLVFTFFFVFFELVGGECVLQYFVDVADLLNFTSNGGEDMFVFEGL